MFPLPLPSSAFFSPRPSILQRQFSSSAAVWAEQFTAEREALQQQIAQQIRQNMTTLVGHLPTADVLLVAANGRKMPAHLCILKRRAPSFYQRYVQATLEAISPRIAERQLLEIAVGDVDSSALEFFIRSIYTEDEAIAIGSVPQENGQRNPSAGPDRDNGESGNPLVLQIGQQQQQQVNDAMTNGHLGGEGFNDAMSISFPSPEAESRGLQLDDQQCTSQSQWGGMVSFRELAESSSQLMGQTASGTKIKPETIISSSKSSSGLQMSKNQKYDDEPRITPRGNEGGRLFSMFIGIDGSDGSAKENQQLMTRSLPTGGGVYKSVTEETGEEPQSPNRRSIMGVVGGSSIRGRAIAARRLSVTSLGSLASLDAMTPSQEFSSSFLTATAGEPPNAASQLATDLLEMYREERDQHGQRGEGDKKERSSFVELGTANVRVECADGELRAHLPILWASCPKLRKELDEQMERSKHSKFLALHKISLPRFSTATVDFFLEFLYGGLTSLPPQKNVGPLAQLDDSSICAQNNWFSKNEVALDPWELVELGAFLDHHLFIAMVTLHVKGTMFHFFHRPCASCVSAVFDALLKMELEIPEIQQLHDQTMQWQSVHFSRIWKGRVFLHLSFRWQKHCCDALLQVVDEENVVEFLLGCEKLQVSLPRVKLQGAAQQVLGLVGEVEEYCMEFLHSTLDAFLQSRAFSGMGRGLALNLALLEDILPTLVHSLCPDTAIRSFLALKQLVKELDSTVERSSLSEQFVPSPCSSLINSPLKKRGVKGPLGIGARTPLFGSNSSINSLGTWKDQLLMDQWNPRFKSLCHCLLDLFDRHMLHYANSIVQCAEWVLLGPDEQARIREFGLFVEIKMPRAPPPRLSSSSRTYKRSSSVGIGGQQAGPSGSPYYYPAAERTRSLERNSPASNRPSLSFCARVEEEGNAGGGEKTSGEDEKERKEDEEEEKRKEENEKERKEDEEEEKRKEENEGESEEMDRGEDQKINSAAEQSGNKIASKLPEAAAAEIGKETKLKRPISRRTMEGRSKSPESPNRKQQQQQQGEKDGHKKRLVAEHSSIASTSSENMMMAMENNNTSSRRARVKEKSGSGFERQRTHTVMTVDQNVKAGINAFLGAINHGDGASGTMATTVKSNSNRMGGKPQSIVRPMQKEQEQQQQAGEGSAIIIERTDNGRQLAPPVAGVSREQQQRTTRRTIGSSKTNMTAAQRNQLIGQTANVTSGRAKARENRDQKEQQTMNSSSRKTILAKNDGNRDEKTIGNSRRVKQ